MFGSFLPSLLVGFSTTKVYSGVGADIVMESITPIDRIVGVIADFNSSRLEHHGAEANTHERTTHFRGNAGTLERQTTYRFL